MSSRSYDGRHAAVRKAFRVPRSLTSGFVLPTLAAATLVLTATGASVAESRSMPTVAATTAAALTFTTQEAEAQVDTTDLTQRRAAASLQAAAIQGREQEAARIARDKARAQAAAKKKAAAKAAREAAARAKAEAAAKKWIMPLSNYTFTSGFKMRWGRMHAGNDFACPVGTTLRSMSRGTVIYAGWQGGYGNKVEIRYWDGTVSYYGHMSSVSAVVGQEVNAGDVVGLSGNTGNSTGPHLHLEIHPGGGGAIDPQPWLGAKGLG